MSFKIGLVTGEYPPMEGGVGAFTQELARELAGHGHTIHIITSHKARIVKNNKSFWDQKEPHDIGFGQLHARINRWWGASVGTIADIAIRYDLDIVNVQYQAAAFSMYIPALNFLPWRLRGLCKSVVTFHDLRVPYLFPKAGSLRRRIVNNLAASADGVIVTNGADYAKLTRASINEEKLAQIPIGSNIKYYAPTTGEIASIRHRLGLGSWEFLLGYFGFVNENKGADVLIKALSLMDRRFHLVFIGARTGSSDAENSRAYLVQLEKLIVELNLAGRVHWSGFLPDDEVSRYLHATDLMVMPYRDGVSLRRGTLMAIIAHGRPLISTRPTKPITELVHGDNVWLTPVDDPAALKDAIEEVTADDELRTKLGKNAQCLAKDFSWEKIAAQTVAFYEAILAMGK